MGDVTLHYYDAEIRYLPEAGEEDVCFHLDGASTLQEYKSCQLQEYENDEVGVVYSFSGCTIFNSQHSRTYYFVSGHKI